jgi:hypothetical protein
MTADFRMIQNNSAPPPGLAGSAVAGATGAGQSRGQGKLPAIVNRPHGKFAHIRRSLAEMLHPQPMRRL